MTYGVRELAEAAGLSVEVVRSYQSKGLLPPPRHEGRLAFYGVAHLERLRAIRALKERGLSLKAVAEVLAAGDESPWPVAGADAAERLTRAEVAERARVPPSMLRSFEASGVLRPLPTDDPERPYSRADVQAVRMLLALVSAGVPMEEFMSVARTQIEASKALAEGASDLFLRYVRAPLHAPGHKAGSNEELATAFATMVRAAAWLVAYNVERSLVAAMTEEIHAVGTRAEQAALRKATAVIDAAVPH